MGVIREWAKDRPLLAWGIALGATWLATQALDVIIGRGDGLLFTFARNQAIKLAVKPNFTNAIAAQTLAHAETLVLMMFYMMGAALWAMGAYWRDRISTTEQAETSSRQSRFPMPPMKVLTRAGAVLAAIALALVLWRGTIFGLAIKYRESYEMAKAKASHVSMDDLRSFDAALVAHVKTKADLDDLITKIEARNREAVAAKPGS